MNRPLTNIVIALLLLLTTLACGGLSLPSQADTEAALGTAQALAVQSGPTLEAMRQEASDLATRSAPTIEAALTQAATIAAEMEVRGENAQATLQAAGIDGNYLSQKVQSLRPDAEGNVSFVITETEMNLALQARQLLGVSPTPQAGEEPTAVQDGVVYFQDGLVTFEGDLLQPLAGRVQISFQPTVVNGQLALQVISAQVGDTAVSPTLLNGITNSLTSLVNSALTQLPTGITLKQLTVGEGMLTLVAGR